PLIQRLIRGKTLWSSLSACRLTSLTIVFLQVNFHPVQEAFHSFYLKAVVRNGRKLNRGKSLLMIKPEDFPVTRAKSRAQQFIHFLEQDRAGKRAIIAWTRVGHGSLSFQELEIINKGPVGGFGFAKMVVHDIGCNFLYQPIKCILMPGFKVPHQPAVARTEL